MATRQRKVERHRAKRHKKQRDRQVFTLRHKQRLASDAHPIHACVVNRNWREAGEATILMAREVAAGHVSMAAFLVDIWAMGLKDAWGRTDIPASKFDESVARLDEQLEKCSLNLGTARHLVYGGIQLARDLGFRLPRRYERWTALLGTLPEGESPDMSIFLCGGKIRLICSYQDLKARIIGTTPEKFLNRPDVEFIMGDDDFTLVDDDDDEFNDMVTELVQKMLDRARQWCFANGQVPHPLLSEVISASLEAIIQGTPPDIDPENDIIEALSDEQQEEVMRQTASFLSASFAHDPDGLSTAMEQFDGFMHSMASSQGLADVFGLGED